MRLIALLSLLIIALAAPVSATPKPEYPWLSLDRISTHIVARQYWETKGERKSEWELPATKLGASIVYKLNPWWNVEGCALHSTRTGREELALSLKFCVPYLSGKPYR